MDAATDIGSVVEWISSQYNLTADENGRLADVLWQFRMGHTCQRVGPVEKCYFLCWNDSTFGLTGANPGGLLERREEQTHERSSSDGICCAA